jgi:hypothetical protein
MHQLRAFLGCCQQLNQYIKDYGIIAKPLHNITKKGAKGPPPWIKGTDYDLAFLKLKVLITDTKLYPHHKDALKRLFLEVDASDVGWGACAYQMLLPYDGDQSEEGRMRIGDTGPRTSFSGSVKHVQHMSSRYLCSTGNHLLESSLWRNLGTSSRRISKQELPSTLITNLLYLRTAYQTKVNSARGKSPR